jgi:uncharacterized membrane protein YfcA
MPDLIAGVPAPIFAIAVMITLFAGFVKGTVGFAMPMVMISGLSSILPPEVALAGLILPTLVTNLYQALRDGVGAAASSVRHYWRFLTGTLIFIAISAQFATYIPQTVFLLLLGVPITLYAGLQLRGVSLAISLQHHNRAEWVLGVIAGLYGGVSGVWGPPLLVLLMSTSVARVEMMRVQGVVFLLGAIILLGAHLQSGVMTGPNFVFSAVLIVPALLGMAIGYRISDKLDQVRFRRYAHILLVLSGLNLIRRALTL